MLLVEVVAVLTVPVLPELAALSLQSHYVLSPGRGYLLLLRVKTELLAGNATTPVAHRQFL
jgi:hypothetical protein